jgi:hypothetical protein
MANTKISALTAGDPAVASDLLPIDRSGSNFSLMASSVAALAPSVMLASVGWMTLPTAKIIPLNLVLGTGDIDLHTVAAGKRATIHFAVMNPTVTASVTIFQEIKLASIYYQIAAAQTSANNAAAQQVAIAFSSYPTLEAGQTFSLNVATTSGLHLVGYVIEFSTSEYVKGALLNTFVSGSNVLYTCPSGKVATFANNGSTNAPIRNFNTSGGQRTYEYYVIPSGQTQAQQYSVSTSATQANNASGGITGASSGFAAGDFITINSDSSASGQLCWIPFLIEIPA